jgi:hypothetical protein
MDYESFEATDSEGRTYVVHQVVTYTAAGGHSVPTKINLKTSDGRSLNRVSQGVYSFVVGGKTLTSDDPSAP